MSKGHSLIKARASSTVDIGLTPISPSLTHTLTLKCTAASPATCHTFWNADTRRRLHRRQQSRRRQEAERSSVAGTILLKGCCSRSHSRGKKMRNEKLAIGIAVGSVVGVVSENVAMGVGIAIGVAMGLAADNWPDRK